LKEFTIYIWLFEIGDYKKGGRKQENEDRKPLKFLLSDLN